MSRIIIECEEGEDFQEYVFDDTGESVPSGTEIGFEEDGTLTLHQNISYMN